jgi:lipopolysaccharide export system permease protein
MKLLDRYLLRELAGPFFLGLFVFTALLFLNQLILLAELVINKGLPATTVGRLLLAILPSFLSLTIPMAVLLGTVVAFGRLSGDNEVIALTSQGVSLWRIGVPVLLFGAATGAITLWVMLVALPWGNTTFKKILFEVASTRASVGLEEGVFTTSFPDMVLYVGGVDSRTGELSAVIIQQPGPQGEEMTLFARRGRLVSDPGNLDLRLALEEVTIQAKPPTGTSLTITRAPRYEQRIRISELQERIKAGGAPPKGEREMNVAELREEIERRRVRGLDFRSLVVEVQKKYAIPFACLVFAVIGVPLGMIARRSDKLVGFGVSMGVIFVYYLFLTSGETLGDKGAFPPAVGMWWGNVIVGVAGILLFRRCSQDLPIRSLELVGDFVAAVRRKLRRRR